MKILNKLIVSLTYCVITQSGFSQDSTSTKHTLSSFYYGGHITPQLSIYIEPTSSWSYTGTAFASSAGFDLYKRISNKLYLKTEILYAFQKGQIIPYWLKFTDTGGGSFEGYEKWSLIKIPLTLNYFHHKPESKIIYYPSIGIEQAFHLKQFNNCEFPLGSTCHYSVINIYSILGLGVIYNISRSINFFSELRIEHNITNIGPIPDDIRDRSRNRERENNMLAGITLGVLFNPCSCNTKK